MSTAQRGRHYTARTAQKTAESMYRQSSYDRSFESVRYPSNASQPSLSHSFATHTESTSSSVCRPDFGDHPHNMSQSDCGASFVSEVPASYDDTSDIDEVPTPNHSKPTLIKFVEPVVHRDPSHGQPRLTGMKKKKMQRQKAAKDDDMDIHHLPLLGFSDARTRYGDVDALSKDTLTFPGVPPREADNTPQHEQWNIDAIDIALEDLVLDKGKTRSTAIRGGAAHSVLDEAQQEERPYRRSLAQSDARRAKYLPPPPLDAPLPPLPPLPSPSTVSQDSAAPSADDKVAGLRPSHEHPLTETAANVVQPASIKSMAALRNTGRSPADSDDDVFAFRPPSQPHDGDKVLGAVPASRPLQSTKVRHNSMASSNQSSLRDMDPREMLQRARAQALSCGLDAEIGHSLDLEAEDLDAARSSTSYSVQAEDLPPLLSNHYLQGHVDQTEYERLNRLPERRQAVAAAAVAAAAAAAAASGSHRLSHKHLAKHKKGAGTVSLVKHYEPISILRAEAAFLKEDTKKSDKPKKDRLWAASSTTNASCSDVSSVSDSQQRLKSFKSSIRLKNLK